MQAANLIILLILAKLIEEVLLSANAQEFPLSLDCMQQGVLVQMWKSEGLPPSSLALASLFLSAASVQSTSRQAKRRNRQFLDQFA